MTETATRDSQQGRVGRPRREGRGRRPRLLRQGPRLDDRGEPGSPVRRLRPFAGRRQGRRRDRPGPVAGSADGVVGLHRHGRPRRAEQADHGRRRHGHRPGVRRRRPGPDGGLPRPGRRLHLGLGGAPDGRLPDRRPRRIRLGGPERPERRGGDPVLCDGVRLDAEADRRRPTGRTRSSRSTAGASPARRRWTRWCRPRCRATGWSTSPSTTWTRPIAPRSKSGARELVPPMDFPGGRMSIVSDPEGAAFGLMTLSGG